jgi:hypothetical protein
MTRKTVGIFVLPLIAPLLLASRVSADCLAIAIKP